MSTPIDKPGYYTISAALRREIMRKLDLALEEATDSDLLAQLRALQPAPAPVEAGMRTTLQRAWDLLVRVVEGAEDVPDYRVVAAMDEMAHVLKALARHPQAPAPQNGGADADHA